MRHFPNKAFASLFAKKILYVSIFSMMFSAALFAQATDICETRLATAEEKYYNGYFETAITLINECMAEKALNSEMKIKACKLLSLSYLANQDMEKAKESVRSLLAMVPAYTADKNNDPMEFVAMVEAVKSGKDTPAEIDKSKALPLPLQGQSADSSGKSLNKWLIISAATGGAIAAIVSTVMNGSSEDGPGGGNPPGNNGNGGGR